MTDGNGDLLTTLGRHLDRVDAAIQWSQQHIAALEAEIQELRGQIRALDADNPGTSQNLCRSSRV